MLNSVPKEKTIDGKNDSDEESPPNAPIFEPAIFLLFFRRQGKVGLVPDDAIRFFLGRRRSQQRSSDHDGHANDPGGEGAMIEGVVLAEEFELEQGPAEKEPNQDREQSGSAIGAFP